MILINGEFSFLIKKKSYNVDEEITKEYDGFYIAGLNENDYLYFFNTTEITSAYQSMPKATTIGGKFDEIYYYNSKDNIIYLNELNFLKLILTTILLCA